MHSNVITVIDRIDRNCRFNKRVSRLRKIDFSGNRFESRQFFTIVSFFNLHENIFLDKTSLDLFLFFFKDGVV